MVLKMLHANQILYETKKHFAWAMLTFNTAINESRWAGLHSARIIYYIYSVCGWDSLLPKFPIHLFCKLGLASCHRKGFCEQPITCTCVRWTNTLSRTGPCYDAERHTKVWLISGQQVLAPRRCAVAAAVFVGRKRTPAGRHFPGERLWRALVDWSERGIRPVGSARYWRRTQKHLNEAPGHSKSFAHQ